LAAAKIILFRNKGLLMH